MYIFLSMFATLLSYSNKQSEEIHIFYIQTFHIHLEKVTPTWSLVPYLIAK